MTRCMCDIGGDADREDARLQAAYEREIAKRQRLSDWHPLHVPRFAQTCCSQCGAALGPGDHGTSHCDNHQRTNP
ncbi:MAG: hypothetical protein RLZZ373_423 [Pseudomonadota bacterium]|jgi:hypothetical protein